MIVAIAVALGLIAAVIIRRRSMDPRLLGGLGAVFVAAGLLVIGYVEWHYLPSNTRPLDATVRLDRAGTTLRAPFRVALDGRYTIWLQTDRTPGVENFGCLTGDDGFEALCPGRAPELDLTWAITERGVAVARGGSDIEGWKKRQAALDPKAAAQQLKEFRTYIAGAANPADATPLFHTFAGFDAKPGHDYLLVINLHHPAPTLAAVHPRITIGFAQTRGIGTLATIFCLLCVAGGFFMLLTAFVPRKAAS
jgi:hypothetical protein